MKEKFCQKCGEELRHVREAVVGYDMENGQPIKHSSFQCPKYTFFSFHTSIPCENGEPIVYHEMPY